MPEGILELAGPGLKIVELCDGSRTFAAMLEVLGSTFPNAPKDRIETDTAAYLERLRDRGAVEF